MTRFSCLLTAALLMAGCAGSAPAATTAPRGTAVAPPAATTTSPSSQPEPPCRRGDGVFHQDGVVAAFGDEGGDASQIAAIHAYRYPGCERVVIDLLTTAGAPAGSIGPVAVETTRGSGIIRVSLPTSIVASSVIDTRFDLDLVSRAFVVRTTAGALAVDIHLTSGAGTAVRSYPLRDPSRIALDLVPDATAPPADAVAVAADLVVVSPRSGANRYPLHISGYARVGDGAIVARLYSDPTADPVAEASSPIPAPRDAWEEFELSLPAGPPGALQLEVAMEDSADDSRLTVTIPVDIGNISDRTTSSPGS
jgi:hypothetical protein